MSNKRKKNIININIIITNIVLFPKFNGRKGFIPKYNIKMDS